MVKSLIVLSAFLGLSSIGATNNVKKSAAMPADAEWVEVALLSDVSDGDTIAIASNSKYMIAPSAASDSSIWGGNSATHVGSYSASSPIPQTGISSGAFIASAVSGLSNTYKFVSSLNSAVGISTISDTKGLRATTIADCVSWELTYDSGFYLKSVGSSYSDRFLSPYNDTDFRSYTSGSKTSVKLFRKQTASEKVITSITVNEDSPDVIAYPGEEIDFSAVKVTGTYDGGTIDVSDHVTFSPTTAQAELGTMNVTVTYDGDSHPTCLLNVTVVEKPAKARFSLVTNPSNLAANDKIIIAADTGYAMGPSQGTSTNGFLGKAVTIDTNKNIDVELDDTDGPNIFTLEAGTGGFYLKESLASDYYAVWKSSSSQDLVHSKTKTRGLFTFSYDSTNKKMSISPASEHTAYSIYSNTSSHQFRLYSSTSQDKVNVYKYASGGEKVTVDPATTDLFVNQTVEITGTAVGFTPSGSWTFTPSNANVEVASQSDNKAIIKGKAAGSCEVEVSNSSFKGKCTVTVSEATYNVLGSKTSGALLAYDGIHYLDGAGISSTTLDVSDTDNHYSFEKAYEGNETYYIKSNKTNSYLSYGSNNKLTFTTNKESYFTLEGFSDGSVGIKADETRYITYYAHDDKFTIYTPDSGNHHIFVLGSLTYDHMTYEGSLTKSTYDSGDEFDPTGLTFYEVYVDDSSNEIKKLFTGTFAWGSLSSGMTSVVGTSGDRTVTVTGITVTAYAPTRLILDATDAKTSYYAGEEITIAGLGISLELSDGTNTKTRELTTSDVTFTPDRASVSVTKVKVIWNEDESIFGEFPITVLENTYKPTNRLSVGDRVIITTELEYTRSEVVGSRELYLGSDSKSQSREYDYAPTTEAASFTVAAGATSGTYAFRSDDGRYLRNLSGRLGLDSHDNKIWSDYDGKFTNLAVTGYGNNNFTKAGATDVSPYGCPVADEDIEEMFFGPYTATYHLYIICQTNETAQVYWTDWETTSELMSGTWGYDGGAYWLDFSGGASETVDSGASWTFTYDRDERVSYISQGSDYVVYNVDSTTFKVKSSLSSTDEQSLTVWSNATTTSATSISVNTDEETTVFEVGDPFTWTGAVVTANYGGGISNTLPVGSYDVVRPDMSTPGTKTVTINYFGLTTSYQIEVNEPVVPVTLISLEITSHQEIYYVGDTVPVFTAVAHYSDPSYDKDVTSKCTYTGFNASTAGSGKTCVVNYKETGQTTQQANFTYTVIDTEVVDSFLLLANELPSEKKVGDTYQIQISNINGDDVGTDAESQANAIKLLKFSSNNEETATVSSTGLITLTGLGQATIKVEARKGSATDQLFMVELHGQTTDIVVDTSTVELFTGGHFQIEATPVKEDGTPSGEKIHYESSNAIIASVDESGYVTARKEGGVNITLYSEDRTISKYIHFEIKVNTPVTGVTLNETAMTLEAGEHFQLVATVLPTDATNKEVTWSSSNPSVATVDENGLVTAVSKGTAVITVTTKTGGKTAECVIKVGHDEPPVPEDSSTVPPAPTTGTGPTDTGAGSTGGQSGGDSGRGTTSLGGLIAIVAGVSVVAIGGATAGIIVIVKKSK